MLRPLAHPVAYCGELLHPFARVAHEYHSRLITATLENVNDFTSTSPPLNFSKNLV